MKHQRKLPLALFAKLVILASFALRVDAGVGSTTLAASSTNKILPEAEGRGYPSWNTNTAYAQGDMVTSSNLLAYMCLVAGTSTNNGALAPNGSYDYVDGTVTWRPALSRVRKLLILCNDGTNTVYVSDEKGMTGNGKGIRLNSSGGAVVFSAPGDYVPQGPVFIYATGASSVSHIER